MPFSIHFKQSLRPPCRGQLAQSLVVTLSMLLLFFSSPGESCDFDQPDQMKKMPGLNSGPCKQWERPAASDGKPGFVVTSWKDIKINNRQGPKTAPGPGHLQDNRVLSGPHIDRSEGTDKGNYAIFSSSVHTEMTQADIQSPWFGSSGPRCTMHFAVHMVGTNVGTLRVLLHTGSGVLRAMWSVVGDKGVRWIKYKVDIGQIEEPFRVIFQAVKGVSDTGHIAIDSISLDYCNPNLPAKKTCSLNEFMCQTKVCIPRDKVCDLQKDCLGGEDENQTYCDTIPERARCNFENGYCECQNLTTKTEHWIRHSGPTPSQDGPSIDHTLGTTAGHYIYTKALEPSSSVEKRFRQHRIYSAVLPPPPPETWTPGSPFYGTCTLRLFSIMSLGSISLKVFLEEMEKVHPPHCDHGDPVDSDNYLIPVMSVIAPSLGEDEWRLNSEPLPKVTKHFRLMFQALVGPHTHATETAMDDFSLSPECFGLGILNITNNASEYIESVCNKTLAGVGKTCYDMGTLLHDMPTRVSAGGECWWTASDFLHHVNMTKASSTSPAFEPITEVINSSARFIFKTCGCTGRSGPTQYQCDAAYASAQLANSKVRVLTKPLAMRGVQLWIVPETRIYSITALGASGGTGLQNSEPSRGAYANAKFNLTKGEEIYMLIGQMGQSACSDINRDNEETKNICRNGIFPSDAQSKGVGGGGGGGGGTYVFKKDRQTHELIPLIIAGGGGGKSYKLGRNPVTADGGLSPSGSGMPGYTPDSGPGAGGGWAGDAKNLTQGLSLLRGALGGLPCQEAMSMYHWQLYGGFGGGGGGCTAGGGGGGYSGGNVSITDDPQHNGQGGSSFISPLGSKAVFEPGTKKGNGEVEIATIFPCACTFMCIYHDYEEKKFKCYCPPNHILADDGTSCIDPNVMTEDSSLPTVLAVTLGPIGLAIIAIACVICVNVSRNKRQPPPGMGLLTRADYQLDQLRSQVGAPNILSEYNPNYDFGGTKCTLQDLQEVPRCRLTLVRGLGQGAFGEVYQGYLSNEPREPREIPVAVKTLPALSTDQAEMDFLMEALIMSKFHHPNIVRFMGVCFEKHPRFIILELLEGGDLKTFLRDSRPKPDQPSRVTMVGLVKLSLDVAKGCQYLEENHFIHRDIAARNCLLTSKVQDTRVAKIADFGMARDIYRADYYRKGGTAMLPVKWMPPEAFLDGIFTSKTDVWSFGILLWEVFSLGYMPYPGRGNQEVMQLVTAGGRLEPPDNCPLPVYHIMNLCWHGVPERRPTFATIIDCLQRCLKDPEVIHSPLPVFRRPPSIERDATIMRPRDSDRMVLTVDPPPKYLEPGSPNSMDQLIGPQSPDIDELLRKKPNMRASAESIDELLHQDDVQRRGLVGAATGMAAPGGEHHKEPPCKFSAPNHFSYQRVWDYDGMEDSTGEDTTVAEVLEAQAVADGGASSVAVGEGGGFGGRPEMRHHHHHHHHPQHPAASSAASPGETVIPRQPSTKSATTAAEEESPGDSGKSSLENMSQTDLSSAQVSGDPSPTHTGGAALESMPRNTARSAGDQQQARGLLPALPTSSSSNTRLQNAPFVNAAGSATGSPAVYPGSACTDAADPWERRQQPDMTSRPQPHHGDLAVPVTANPCYVNVDMAGSDVSGNTGVHGSRPLTTYRTQMPSMGDSREDEEAGQDPGDSGVVIDLKGCNTSLLNKGQLDNGGQTWL